MIHQGEVLTLTDNKKYLVVSSIIYENVNYIYLIDQTDIKNILFCWFDDKTNELVEVQDVELLKKITELFLEK